MKNYEQIIKKHPELKQEIDELKKDLAKDFLSSMVDNELFNGQTNGAWHTICDSYNITPTNDLLLYNNRLSTKEKIDEFLVACKDKNYEKITKMISEGLTFKYLIKHVGFNNFAPEEQLIKIDLLNELLHDDNHEVFSFILTDPYLTNNKNFSDYIKSLKDDFHTSIFLYEKKDFLKTIIMIDNYEFDQDFGRKIKFTSDSFQGEIINFIKNKHLNCILNLTTNFKKETENKPKI